jgi:hypothetical protein
MTEPTHTTPAKPLRAAGPIPAAVIGLLRGGPAPAEPDGPDGPVCGAAAFLRAGGPVRVPFQQCCAVALLQAARDPGPTAAPPFCPERLSADLAPVPVARPSEVIA